MTISPYKIKKEDRPLWLQTLLSFDYLLALAVVALSVFGVFMIYAATNTGYAPSFANLHNSQRLYVITGVFMMILFALIDYRFINRFYIFIYVLLVGVLVTMLIIGKDDFTGTGRWIWLTIPGYGKISLQPSEFAKIFMILVMAKFLETRKDNFNHILMLGLILAGIALPVFLVFKQPSLSASMVIGFTSLVILFTAGLYYRTLLVSSLLIVPVGLVVWFDMLREEPLFITRILQPYQWIRVQTFLNPVPGSDEYLQIQGSLYAIGSGGLHGKGFMKNGHVINGHNDLIFSVVAEQFGFIGCAALLGVVAFIIIKCILIALRADDLQGRLIAAGVGGMLIFETFVNVGVATSILPATGIAFPFLSAGGSIMWVHMIAIGLVLNVGLPRSRSMFDKEK